MSERMNERNGLTGGGGGKRHSIIEHTTHSVFGNFSLFLGAFGVMDMVIVEMRCFSF